MIYVKVVNQYEVTTFKQVCISIEFYKEIQTEPHIISMCMKIYDKQNGKVDLVHAFDNRYETVYVTSYKKY